MLCIYYNACSVSVLVIPEATFLTPLLIPLLPLIKAPHPTFLVMSIPTSLKTTLPALLGTPFPAFFKPLYPTRFVTNLLLPLGLYRQLSSLYCSPSDTVLYSPQDNILHSPRH